LRTYQAAIKQRTPIWLAPLLIYLYNDDMNQSAYLHRLQRVDSQIDQIEARLAEIERLLSEDERIRNARQEVEDSRRDLEISRQALRAIEHNAHETRIKAEQSEASLYGGSIRNPKELQDLQREIDSLKRHLSALEDEQLQAMLDQEEMEKKYQSAQDKLNRAVAEVTQQKAGLAGERDSLSKKRQSLEAERSAALGPVLPQNLETYIRIREQKKGIAVTAVDEDTCAICGAEVRLGEGQAARMQSNLHFCTSCGRILFAG
jgi:predicted  nucleic acid-binding Zn-ribbon protein